MTTAALKAALMGGVVDFVLYDVPQDIAALLYEELWQEGLRLQRIFNFFDPQSELSTLNRERRLTVSDELLEVLIAAMAHCWETDGEYDISIGKQILERKSGRELTSLGCTYKDIKITGHTVTLTHPDVLIDLGSIAKGYIGDKLAAFLKMQGVTSFFIDARGDMIAAGDHVESVEIQHPRQPSSTIEPFRIKNAAVATSGDYHQYHGSYEKSHILKQKDLISVTVVADTLMDADVFASVVFLAAPAEREGIIAAHPGYKVCTIDKALNTRHYNGFRPLVLV